jgi:hypothetical protein
MNAPVTLESPEICPWPRCDAYPQQGAQRCPACQNKLLTCHHCSSPNRSTATFCRQCGELILPKDEWRYPRGNPEQTGYLPSRILLPAVGTNAATDPSRRERRLKASVEAPPVTAFDYVFVPTREACQILRLDTLEPVGTVESPGRAPLIHAPVLHAGRLYLASQQGAAIYDIKSAIMQGDSPGILRPALIAAWSVPEGEYFTTSLLPVEDGVFYCTNRGLYRWTPSQMEPQLALHGESYVLARRKDELLVAPGGSAIVAVDRAGRQRWQSVLTRHQQQIGLDARAGIAVQGDQVYCLGEDNQLWRSYAGQYRAMALAQVKGFIHGLALLPEGGVVAAGHSGLIAVESSGRPSWSVPHDICSCAPIATEHLVLAGTESGAVLIAEQGTDAWDKRPVGTGAVMGVAVSGPTVVAVTSQGDVAAFDLPVREEL